MENTNREPLEAKKPLVNPKLNRCTDICCLLLLFANCTGMVFVMRYALLEGNVDKLTHGYDWRLQTCGVSADVVDKPYLYWCAKNTDGNLNLTDGICVESCPTSDSTVSACPGEPHFYQNKTSDVDGAETWDFGITRTLEDVPNYASKSFPLVMYCFPNAAADQANYKQIMDLILASSQFKGDFIFKLGEGLMNQGWQTPTIVAITTIIFCYLFVFVMRFVVRILMFLLMVSLELIWLALAAWCTYGYLHPEASPLRRFIDDPKDASLYACIALWVLALPILCLLVDLYRRLDLVVKAVEDAGDALVKMPTLLLVPLMQVVFQLVIVGGAAYGLLWILSLGEIQPETSINVFNPNSFTGDVTSVRRKVAWTSAQKWIMVYWVLSALWLQQIAVAAGRFVISFSVVKFKWQQHRCGTMIFQGYFSAFVLHLGTLAFGGFILGVMWALVVLVKFVARQARSSSGEANALSKCLECCCVGCLLCLTKLVEYLNAMTYTECAITGDSYCKAAMSAWSRLAADADAFALVRFVTGAVRFLGVFVATIGGTWLVSYLQRNSSWRDAIESVTGISTGEFLVAEHDLAEKISAGVVLFVISASFMEIFDWTSNSLMYVILWIKEHDDDDKEGSHHSSSAFEAACENVRANSLQST